MDESQPRNPKHRRSSIEGSRELMETSDESPRTVLSEESQLSSLGEEELLYLKRTERAANANWVVVDLNPTEWAVKLEDSAPDLLPTLERCPFLAVPMDESQPRKGMENGDESPRTVLSEDSEFWSLGEEELLHLNPREQAANANSFPELIPKLEESARHLLPALDGCPARSAKRPRVVVDLNPTERAVNLEDSAPDLLPALERCPFLAVPMDESQPRKGMEKGDESPRTVLSEDSEFWSLAEEEPMYLNPREQAVNANSFQELIPKLEESAPNLLPALDGCPARSAKRRRVVVDQNPTERVANMDDSAPDLLPARSAKRRRAEEEGMHVDTLERADNADSNPLAEQELGLKFDKLPDEILVKILVGSDQASIVLVSAVCKTLRSMVKRNSSSCCGRFSTPIDCELYSTAGPTSLSTICSLGRDALLNIMCKLATSDIARLGRTCSAFRCLLVCADSRCFIRKFGVKCQFLGALICCNPLSRYPVLLSTFLPRHQQPLVDTFSTFWRNFARDNRLKKPEVVDCRDGRVLLREGKSNLSGELIVCNPFAVNTPTTVVKLSPDLTQEAFCYVCCTFVPDDDGCNFSVIMLMAGEGPCPDGSIKIWKYVSDLDCWIYKRHMWESEALSRSTVRLPSVLSDQKVHYLQPTVQIVSVDTHLNIDTIPVPEICEVSYHNHLLVHRTSGMLCLAVVTRGKIRVFLFVPSCSTWIMSKEFEIPGEETDCRVVGSRTDKILFHAAGRLCILNLNDGCCFDVSNGSKFIREAFCYELQHPPVAEFLRRLH